MTNLSKISTGSIMLQISKAAPFGLLVFALLSFVAVGVFAYDYYRELFLVRFPSSAAFMAILCAIIQEAVRFGLLVASIRDFTDSKPANGWLGLLGSIALVLHDIVIAKAIGRVWSPADPDAYVGLLVFLILTGLLLEIRLILTVGGSPKRKANNSRSRNGVSTVQGNGVAV